MNLVSHIGKAVQIALLALMAAGCATPTQPPKQTSRTYDATKEEIWPLLVTEIAPHYPVRVIEKASGLITTDFVLLGDPYRNPDFYVPSQNILCTWSSSRVNLSAIAIEPTPGKTRLSVTLHYEVFESGIYKTWMAAQTTGELESQILDHIEGQVFNLREAAREKVLSKAR